MINKLKANLKNHRGDVYIEFLICLILVAMTVLLVIQLSSAMTQKSWINDKLGNITELIALTGDINDERVVAAENVITDRMGGAIVYSSDGWVEDGPKDRIINTDGSAPIDGRIQLGSSVNVRYSNDHYPIINVGNGIIAININIDIDRQAVSEQYFKPPVGE